MISNQFKAVSAALGVLVAGCSDPKDYVVSGVQFEPAGIDANKDGFLALSDYQLMPLRSNDVAALKSSEGSVLSGATLPSGAIVPKGKDGYEWVAKKGELEFQKLAPQPSIR